MTAGYNRAKMTTPTTGTGTLTLGSAVDGFQSFAAAGVANAATVAYIIEDGDAFEIGTGVYSTSGTTLTRVVEESSNADAALNLTGSAQVFIGLTAAAIAGWGYESAETTLTASGSSTNFAHGLLDSAGDPVTPTRFQCHFICKTAEHGYAVDDLIELPTYVLNTNGVEFNGTISADDTNVTISKSGAAWVRPPKAGGTSAILTNASWRMIVRASL